MKSHQRPALTNEHVQLGLMRANTNSEPQLNAIPHSHEMYTTKKKPVCNHPVCNHHYYSLNSARKTF